MKFGCCISIKNIQLAKKFGFDFVELSAKEIMSIEEIKWIETKHEILEYDIPIIGFNAFADKSMPIIGPNALQKNWEPYLDTVLARAFDLNAKNVGIGAPLARMIPSDYNHEQATTEMENFLSVAAEKAEKFGITILYEALHPKECNFGNHTIEIYNSVLKINHSNLKIVYDVYHAINANETYEESKDLFDKISHIHINSWNHDLKRFYLFEKDSRYIHDFFKFLKSVNYDKTISIEASDENFENIGISSIQLLKKEKHLEEDL